MKLQFTVEPMLESYEGNCVRMSLLFESNFNMAQSRIDKIYYKDDKIDRRKRLLDEMFYELRQRITEQEDTLDKFLEAIK
jgi:hypothetical protein